MIFGNRRKNIPKTGKKRLTITTKYNKITW